MANPKTPKQFIEFLKEKKIYRQFKENLKNNNVGAETDLDTFVDVCEAKGVLQQGINEAFLWSETDLQEEGFQFWNDLDTEWQKKQ